uniref:GDP-Man:Man(3)GlcNAc(2)-PP-Dol alpha-1,2-mannosyltransferase n=1 Tax=Globodera rostochiensis TaxID=31243 RepID=A0A914HQR7_GLORO
MSLVFLSIALLPLFPFLLIVAVSRIYFRQKRVFGTFAFFHPYCDAGGGGERVLWLAINAIQKKFGKHNGQLQFVIYTGDIDRTPEQIIEKVRVRFGVSVPSGQMFAGFALGVEALCRHCPEWFVDTTGCPLTLPLFRWIASAKTMCYVHYPLITTEMVKMVDSRAVSYNNSSEIASSAILTNAKLFYYRFISLLYRACGHSSQMTMANGSWTAAHIANLWLCQPKIVFPPCDIETLEKLENRSEKALEGTALSSIILSVGQIRPEKNHLEQLRIFADVRRQLKERGSNLKLKLVIAGGCRNASDWDRSDEDLDSDSDVAWRLNVPFTELTELFTEAMIGLHTMWNEHFGISVAEGMAAGILMVAHNSGGPKLDIIADDGTSADENGIFAGDSGFLATTKEEYVEAILRILDLDRLDRNRIRKAARQRVKRFSDREFERSFCEAIEPLLRGEGGER